MLTKSLNKPNNLLNHVLQGWKGMAADLQKKKTFTTKIKYLLMPPGRGHDGSTKTAVQPRNELKERLAKPPFFINFSS
ncbi:MAG: hypothetical protein ACKVOM_14535 [Ferruginibacter sp.]